MPEYNYGKHIKELLKERKSKDEIIKILLKNEIPLGNIEYAFHKIKEDANGI